MMGFKEDKNFAKALEAFYRKRGYSDLEKVRAALEAYFPQAIAEAVAAERERIVTLMDKRISRFSEDHRRYIRRTEARGILRDLIHAIRSTTK